MRKENKTMPPVLYKPDSDTLKELDQINKIGPLRAAVITNPLRKIGYIFRGPWMFVNTRLFTGYFDPYSEALKIAETFAQRPWTKTSEKRAKKSIKKTINNFAKKDDKEPYLDTVITFVDTFAQLANHFHATPQSRNFVSLTEGILDNLLSSDKNKKNFSTGLREDLLSGNGYFIASLFGMVINPMYGIEADEQNMQNIGAKSMRLLIDSCKMMDLTPRQQEILTELLQITISKYSKYFDEKHRTLVRSAGEKLQEKLDGAFDALPIVGKVKTFARLSDKIEYLSQNYWKPKNFAINSDTVESVVANIKNAINSKENKNIISTLDNSEDITAFIISGHKFVMDIISNSNTSISTKPHLVNIWLDLLTDDSPLIEKLKKLEINRAGQRKSTVYDGLIKLIVMDLGSINGEPLLRQLKEKIASNDKSIQKDKPFINNILYIVMLRSLIQPGYDPKISIVAMLENINEVGPNNLSNIIAAWSTANPSGWAALKVLFPDIDQERKSDRKQVKQVELAEKRINMMKGSSSMEKVLKVLSETFRYSGIVIPQNLASLNEVGISLSNEVKKSFNKFLELFNAVPLIDVSKLSKTTLHKLNNDQLDGIFGALLTKGLFPRMEQAIKSNNSFLLAEIIVAGFSLAGMMSEKSFEGDVLQRYATDYTKKLIDLVLTKATEDNLRNDVLKIMSIIVPVYGEPVVEKSLKYLKYKIANDSPEIIQSPYLLTMLKSLAIKNSELSDNLESSSRSDILDNHILPFMLFLIENYFRAKGGDKIDLSKMNTLKELSNSDSSPFVEILKTSAFLAGKSQYSDQSIQKFAKSAHDSIWQSLLHKLRHFIIKTTGRENDQGIFDMQTEGLEKNITQTLQTMKKTASIINFPKVEIAIKEFKKDKEKYGDQIKEMLEDLRTFVENDIDVANNIPQESGNSSLLNSAVAGTSDVFKPLVEILSRLTNYDISHVQEIVDRLFTMQTFYEEKSTELIKLQKAVENPEVKEMLKIQKRIIEQAKEVIGKLTTGLKVISDNQVVISVDLTNKLSKLKSTGKIGKKYAFAISRINSIFKVELPTFINVDEIKNGFNLDN